MFTQARIKLTAWYLVIIMAISLSFSGVIYVGINRELTRIENFEVARRERNSRISSILDQYTQERIARGLPPPLFEPEAVESNTTAEARTRILLTLGIINASILVVSGIGGYFLAGRTLKPIALMMDEQKEFVSNASHELRTPLTSLKSEIEVALRDKKITLSQAKKLLTSNLEEVDKIHKLSDYLLKLNKYEAGAPTPVMGKLNLKTLAGKAIEKVLPLAKAKKVKIEKKLASAYVEGNKDSLIELTTILLDNAIKYSKPGGKVVIIISKAGPLLEVKDSGIGIAKKDLPHIFDRFYRSEASRSREKTDGYGLGLSIAKSIAQLHGARIQVTSTLNRGSSFKLKFS
jgi:two-component system sensor histidine kinase CiaH